MTRSVTEIQADLTIAREALRVAASAQSYTLDDGQGKQTVQRANVSELRKWVKDLEAELEDATEGGGILAGNFNRGMCG